MQLEDRFNGAYITSQVLKDEPELLKPLEIKEVMPEMVNNEDKIVMEFVGVEKKLVINHTNYKSISEKLGSETDNWIGSKLTLKIADALFNNKRTDSVRIEKVD